METLMYGDFKFHSKITNQEGLTKSIVVNGFG